jgi:SOS-response transcriptional repressor LexA
MEKSLTTQQQNVLDYVKLIIKNRGEPPKIREIAKHLGLNSPGNVHRILVELEKKGHIDLRRTTTIVELPANRDGIKGGKLTQIQAEIYDSVVSRIGSGKGAPSIRMIRHELLEQHKFEKLAVRQVDDALKELERQKRIVLTPKQSHSVALITSSVSTLYPVVVDGVPCPAASFLQPIKGTARVISLPLAELMHRFVGLGVFGVELLDNRQLQQFSKGDYILFEKNSEPDPGGIVAFEYSAKIAVRNFYSIDSNTVRLSFKSSINHDRTALNGTEDIIAPRHEIIFLGVAVAVIMRTLQ